LVKKLFLSYLTVLSLFFMERVGLYILYKDRFSEVGNSLQAFLVGVRFDTIIASVFFIIALIIFSFTPKRWASFSNILLKIYFSIVFSVIIFALVATYPFFAEYDVRLNYLAVEFLAYPKEVFGMIITGYKIPLFVAFFLILIFNKFYLKSANYKDALNESLLKRLILFPIILIILAMGIRSSFGHRPVNVSDAMFSTNRVLNEIANNSIYTLAYSIYANNKYESKNLDKLYGKIDKDEAFDRVKKRLNIALTGATLNRFVKSRFRKQKNIIIFIQESFGYQFINDKITPNVMRLKNKGIFFDNLYSNGTRSVRGIAGVVSGNFSIPGKGVVKRNKSQNGFFTLNRAVKSHRYKTMFIYGGESRFDNMRGWFIGNGFDEIIDEPKFQNYSFKGNWGIGDRDVVKKADNIFNSLYRHNQKFAAVIFSTTNHTPYDLPKDFKYLQGYKKRSVYNTIHYADKAIGDLISYAKRSGYYRDTIFLIVGDHNIRVYGKDVIPVDMFQILGIIVGGGVKKSVYNQQTTQPDLLATVLDLAGISGNFPIMGHSIYSNKKAKLNLLQFHNRYALMVKNRVAVVVPKKGTATYLYKNKHLVKTKSDEELEKDLLSFIYVLNHLYQNKNYK